MQIFLVSRKTLYNCFDSWEDRGILGLYHRPGQGRKPTFTPEEMEQVRLWANAYPRQLKQVLQKVKEQWGKTVSHELASLAPGRRRSARPPRIH
jgi:transposase